LSHKFSPLKYFKNKDRTQNTEKTCFTIIGDLGLQLIIHSAVGLYSTKLSHTQIILKRQKVVFSSECCEEKLPIAKTNFLQRFLTKALFIFLKQIGAFSISAQYSFAITEV
jgi:hypothetical protein